MTSICPTAAFLLGSRACTSRSSMSRSTVAEPTNTPFHTDVITRQYDGVADFPLYPLNVISLLNAVLGLVYVHLYPFDVSLADPSTPLPDTHGDTSYYFFETPDLPLFGPLRTLGVPEPLIDVFEPFFRVLVELGYDRTIPPWEPTPARLIPTFDPVTLVADLVDAIGEGINNAAALIGSPAPLSLPAAQPTREQVVSAPEATLSRVSLDGSRRRLSRRLSPGNRRQRRAPAPKLEPQLSLTSSPVADLSPTTTELRSNPTATTKDNAGPTTTNNSLTTTDLTLPSTLSPSAPLNGPLVRSGNLFTPGCHHAGRDAKRNDEHAVNDGHHDDNHRHHDDDNDHRYQYDDRRFKQRRPRGC